MMGESNQELPDDLKGEKLLDHNYDDIQELDNPLPAWWTYLFYITIIFSFFYMVIFTFFIDSAGARADQAVKKMTQPAVQKEPVSAETGDDLSAPAPEAAAAEPVFDADEDTIDAGKKVYLAKCMACHGTAGEGLVGPNLTDKYWIHGKGTEPDMYKVVVEGVPDKGMIPWKNMISDEEIRAVVVYIKTLQGTSPPNPKAPQGELVE